MRGQFEDAKLINSTLLEQLKMEVGTGTFSSDALTVAQKMFAYVLTTESKTTAHTAAVTLVITRTGTASTDVAFCIPNGGTNTQGVPTYKAVCTTNTITITLLNGAIATNAFNGTFVFVLLVVRPGSGAA